MEEGTYKIQSPQRITDIFSLRVQKAESLKGLYRESGSSTQSDDHDLSGLPSLREIVLRVETARINAKMSTRRLYELARIGVNTLKRLTAMVRLPSLMTLNKLAETLSLNQVELAGLLAKAISELDEKGGVSAMPLTKKHI